MQHLRASAILFDLDGTLIDSAEASEATWQSWAAAHRVSMASIRAVHHGRRPEETIAIVAPHLNARDHAQLIYRGQEKIVHGIHPIPGANSFFNSVPRGRVAIVTAATSRILNLRLQLVGLDPPEVCVTADTLKVGKPDPEGYLEAARRLECDPAQCLVFEDAPAGLIAAHRAGMRSVAILSNYTEGELRDSIGDVAAPAAFLPDFIGLGYSGGVLSVPE